MVTRHQKCCLQWLLSKFYVHMHIFKLALFHYCSGPGFPGDGIFISWLPCKLRYRIIIGYLQGFFYLFFVGVGGGQDIHARTYMVCIYSIILANLAYLKRTGSRKFQVVIKIQFIWCVTYSFESTEELRLQ